jgi:ribosome maturation factor RimP
LRVFWQIGVQMDIVGKVRDLAGPLSRARGLELLDVTYRREGGNHVLRVTIERENGRTSVADCTDLSRAIDSQLEALIPSRFRLEVASGGAERPLANPGDFRRSIGRQVLIRLRNGRPEGVFGELLNADADSVALKLPGGEIRNFTLSDIESARRTVVFPQRAEAKRDRN